MLLKLALVLLTALGPSFSDRGAGTFPAPQNPDRLTESFERRANEQISPALVMDLAGVKPGMVVGEVGAGRGRVTVHLADRVGAGGFVYANDIDASSLDYLRARVKRLGLTNVDVVQGTVEDPLLPAAKLDLALMVMVYHHLDEPVLLLKNLRPCLKPGASVAMVEPTPADTEAGRRTLTRRQVEEDAAAAGYRLEAMIEGRFRDVNVFVLKPNGLPRA